jgi:class 3 adenylate cyclase
VFAEALDATVAAWGEEDLIWSWAPSVGDDPRARRFFSRFTRMSSSPGAFRDHMRVNAQIDVRALLPLIGAPALVLHRRDDIAINVRQGAYAAAHLPSARFVELPGEDHLLIGGDPEPFLDEVERFLTGTTSGRDGNRVLATIVFTDIVGSTELVGRLGDRRWRELLDEHEALLRRRLPEFSGRQVNTTGDGMVAAFTGPVSAVGWAQAVANATEALGIRIRAGVHTGEVELRGTDLAGASVHVAARIAALAAPGEILVSQTVRDLMGGSGVEFVERGSHRLKGMAETWTVHAARCC